MSITSTGSSAKLPEKEKWTGVLVKWTWKLGTRSESFIQRITLNAELIAESFTYKMSVLVGPGR